VEIHSTAMDTARIRHVIDLLGPRKLAILAALALTLLVVDLLALSRAVDLIVAAVVSAAAIGLAVLNWRERVGAVRSLVRSQVDEARDLLRDGHFQPARAKLGEALVLDPGNDQAYLLLSAMRRATHDTDGALAELMKAVMENPSSATHHYNLATAYVERGEMKAGMEQLMAAIERDEYLLDAYSMLGFLYEADDQPMKAVRCYEEMFWMADHWPPQRPHPGAACLDKARTRQMALLLTWSVRGV